MALSEACQERLIVPAPHWPGVAERVGVEGRVPDADDVGNVEDVVVVVVDAPPEVPALVASHACGALAFVETPWEKPYEL